MNVIQFSAVLVLLVSWVAGEKVADLKLHFRKYVNPEGTGSNGHCCDGKWGICQGNGCDHYFVICVDEANSPTGTDACKYLKKTSDTLHNTNENIFGQTMAGLENPMVIPLQDKVPDGLTLKVDVWDFDRTSRDDHVDSLRNDLSPVGINGERLPLMIRSRTILFMEIELVCADNWFGPTCNKTCVEKGNVAQCDSRGNAICKTGWVGASCETPTEKNECLLNLHNCHRHADCNDTKESFQCTCKEGFVGDGVTCTDVDECLFVGNNGCQAPAVCINTIGSFKCFCPQGYRRNGLACDDINECLEENFCGNGSSKCINKIGSYECQCRIGYEKKHSSGVCQDMNECSMFGDALCNDNARCVNKEGSFGCECTVGYRPVSQTENLSQDVSCTDIDECRENTHRCNRHATCINVNGSYTCRCNRNYYGDGKISCRPSNQVDAPRDDVIERI